ASNVGNPNILRVRLAADNGSAQPGATMETLSENQAIWPPFSTPFTTTTTLVSSLNPLLIATADFWIVTEPTQIPPEASSTVDYRWFKNTIGALVPVRQQLSTTSLPTDPWTDPPFLSNPALRVTVNTQTTVGAIVVWEDYRAGSSNSDIYAQHVYFDGTVDPA